MKDISLELDKHLKVLLDKEVKIQGKSKSSIVTKAIESYLLDLQDSKISKKD